MNLICLVKFSFITLIGCLSLFLNTPTPEPTAIPKTVYHIAISGDRRVLAVTYGTYAYRSFVDFFDSTNGQLFHTVDLDPLVVQRIALSPTGDRLLFTSGGGSELNIYVMHTGVTEILWNSNVVSTKEIGWNPVSDEIAYVLGGRHSSVGYGNQ
jgi:hypothetical protein